MKQVNDLINDLVSIVQDDLNVTGVTAEVSEEGCVVLVVYVFDYDVLIDGYDGVPDDFGGLDVVVKPGMFYMTGMFGGYAMSQEVYDPVRMGCEVGLSCGVEHCDRCVYKTGTLGCFVVLDGDVYAVTAGHVVDLEGHDTVVQPKGTAMRVVSDEIRVIDDRENGLDVGLFKVDDADPCFIFGSERQKQYRRIGLLPYGDDRSQYERKLAGFIQDVSNESVSKKSISRRNNVYKVGRSTGLTCGRVSAFHIATRELLSLSLYAVSVKIKASI